ncbi:hypothetical protein CAPTEDRAFT_96227 [Capitella teleta]|uniref:Uncharacterized protein n=1 Tax=Capitella teleta TaxID=283909 RepID=R7UUT2_CAPTE|nr:hypothetical protein CAPTEDRAFT_96227 [Capitella teleta]|eukprot:ELU07687.1 hypothetical protein CAPTEDRAFT_96227 [Capitella teleta]
MLQEVQQPDCSFDELDVKVAIPNLLIAGVGTFSHFFLYFMNVMANNQGVLRKVQDEIDLVMDNGRSLSNIHKDGMPYTYATQMELTRYLSLTPMGLPHATLRDTSIAQFHLPEGTEIMANLWHLHHDEDFWDAPFEFKPERFLDEQGKLLSSSHPNRKHVMAYGAGQRVCLGEAMGKIHLFAYCAVIARNFNIKSGPQVVTCDPRDFIPGAVIEMPDFELVFESRL